MKETVAYEQRCNNTEEHSYHPHEVEVEVICFGTSRCGKENHPTHRFKETQEKWCHGICKCTFIRELHGPGSHK